MSHVVRDMGWLPSERSGDSGSSGDGRTLEGYAAVFDQDTEINSWEGSFTERISKGAFRKTLRERKPILQFNHGRDARYGQLPIGVYEELREDDKGLYVRGKLFEAAEPIREAIAGGAVTGMSFAFRVTRDEWRDRNGKLVRGDEINKLLWEPGDRGPLQRTIKEVQLYEAGPVVTPAYSGTSVGVRDHEQAEVDREALIAEYRQSMAESERDHDTERWLEAERAWQEQEDATRAWLAAEVEWREDVTAWLSAESDYKTSTSGDAAARSTSSAVENPEADAARRGTSNRETENETSTVTRSIPMTLEELRARLAEIDVRLTDLGTEYRGVELPDAAQTEWDGLEAERSKVDGSIKRIEARLARMTELAEAGSSERGSDAGPAFHKKPDVFDVDAIRKDARSEDDFALRLRDNAMRAVEGAHFSPQVDRSASQAHIESLLANRDGNGDLAKRILATGSPAYERAFSKAAMRQSLASLSQEEQRDLSVGSNADGGYAVPFQLDPTVIHTSAQHINPLRSLARVVQITGKEWQGVTSAGITVSRSAEAAKTDGTSPTLAQPKVKAERVTAFVPYSMEVEEDWAALRSEITMMLGEAKDVEEAVSFMTGNGTSPNPEGLLVGVTSAQDVNAGQISTSPLKSADLFALEEALPVRYRANAHFLGNKSAYNKVRQIDAAGGADLWERIGAGLPSQLIGYPIHEASTMAAYPSTASAVRILLLGDFRHFLIVDRIGMSVELVPHVFTNGTAANTIVPTGQRGLFAIWRNNCKVLVPDAFRVLKTKATA